MVQYRARLFLTDVGFYSSIVLSAAAARCPGIAMRDVWKGGRGDNQHEDTIMHVFSCFSEDLEMLRASALKLFEAKRTPIPVAEIRSKALEIIQSGE